MMAFKNLLNSLVISSSHHNHYNVAFFLVHEGDEPYEDQGFVGLVHKEPLLKHRIEFCCQLSEPKTCSA